MPRASRRFSPQTLIVLELLARAGGEWTYGLEIARATGLKSGSLYPILVRLAERGLLESSWQDSEMPGRPRRHAYRITAAGRTALREVAQPGSPAVLREALR
ncbi:helix-turn-helix transcriptional regulator [Sphingomonas sp.]|uniref:PadR family transcriptional regulator n=1 Tax=Sphingomonas sp. TaxID=28214 RepID=UPI001B1AE75C|nr:helix-turn-helix transcriptional regulator [Sphingomonas sp.]MBO9711382.1 helix-turn-helix transcriptional regulator [Sphingomonas sp.]